ncbi:MAG: phage holin family protein [Alphaproteobacteria bacterium]|nr:phage holin family protein [Alphaproteobacteria bacterium]
MLHGLLRTFGVEIDHEVERLKYRFELLRRQTIVDLKSYGQDAGIVVGLMAGAGALLLGVCLIGLIALYSFVAQRYGYYAGLGVLAAVLFIGAVILYSIGRGRAVLLSAAPPKPLEPPVLPFEPASPARGGPGTGATESWNLGLARLVPPPGPDATALETVVHRVSVHAAEAAEKAVDHAAHTVRTGSRGALLATLGLAVLAGMYYGSSKHKGLL